MLREAKVIVKPARYKPDYFCFDILFDDQGIKSYAFDRYEIAAARMSERDLIASLAADYYEAVSGVRPEISLTFY